MENINGAVLYSQSNSILEMEIEFLSVDETKTGNFIIKQQIYKYTNEHDKILMAKQLNKLKNKLIENESSKQIY